MIDQSPRLSQKDFAYGFAHGTVMNDDAIPALGICAGWRPSTAIDIPVKNRPVDFISWLELARDASASGDLSKILQRLPCHHSTSREQGFHSCIDTIDTVAG